MQRLSKRTKDNSISRNVETSCLKEPKSSRAIICENERLRVELRLLGKDLQRAIEDLVLLRRRCGRLAHKCDDLREERDELANYIVKEKNRLREQRGGKRG